MCFCHTGRTVPWIFSYESLSPDHFKFYLMYQGRGRTAWLFCRKMYPSLLLSCAVLHWLQRDTIKKLFLFSFSAALNHFGVKLPLVLSFPV